MTPAQKAQQTAYNEFIADYVERHGECKATRDGAHEVADWVVAMVKDVASVVIKYGRDVGLVEDSASDLAATIVDECGDIDSKDEAKYLADCAIAAALEVVG